MITMNDTPRKAIILAAGMATRMLPLSLDTPKPVMPLWGRPVIGHILALLARWKIREVLVNLHFNPSPICEYLRTEKFPGLRITCSFEPEILGTGGVLRRADWFLDDRPFWMVNADIAADLDPAPLLAVLRRPKTVAALWMEPECGPRTVEMRSGNITDFQTSRPGTNGTYTFCGLQLISPGLLPYLPPDSFCSIIRAYENAMRAGKTVRGVCVPKSYWADLGTPDSYLRSHAEIRERAARDLPGRILYIPPDQRLLREWRRQGVSLKGFTAIDRTAKIMPGARIENSVIWRGASIGPGGVVKNAIVGSDCAITGRVPRLAVKPSFIGKSADIQLNMALARLHLEPDRATIIPFEPRGSARSFTRISAGKRNFIMIRYSRKRYENCLYARHAAFLKNIGLKVPDVIADCPEHQFSIMQDLGDRSLQNAAEKLPPPSLLNLYRRVLPEVARLHSRGGAERLRQNIETTAPFSPDLYRWEREFFARHFLAPHLKVAPAETVKVMEEMIYAGRILNRERQVLIHRDLQSSNIILAGRDIYFIDFQGMRPGPAAYDLASLLCDPYIGLAKQDQLDLLDCYNRLAGPEGCIARDIFWIAAVQRLAQALGAYGRLSALPDTAWFRKYIPPALDMMHRALQEAGMNGILAGVVAGACRRNESRG